MSLHWHNSHISSLIYSLLSPFTQYTDPTTDPTAAPSAAPTAPIVRQTDEWMNTHDLTTSWVFILWLIGCVLFFSYTFFNYFDLFMLFNLQFCIQIIQMHLFLLSLYSYCIIICFVCFILFHARQPSTQPSGRPTGFTNNMAFDYNTVQTGMHIVYQCLPIFWSLQLNANLILIWLKLEGAANSFRAVAWSSATNAVAVGSTDSSFLVLHTTDAWKSWSVIIVSNTMQCNAM